MKARVLIPAFNAAAAIPSLVRAIRQLGFDVLVIDDGSTDRTAAAARAAGADVISQQHNTGKGAALRRGIEATLARREYDAVVMMDGDGQHDPHELPNFVATAQAGTADMVIGNRMARRGSMPLVRWWTNGFMSWLISRIVRQRLPDTQCGFRLIRCDLLRRCTLQANRFEIDTELILNAARHHARISSIPIATIYSSETSQIRPVGDTMRFAWFLCRYLRCRR